MKDRYLLSFWVLFPVVYGFLAALSILLLWLATSQRDFSGVLLFASTFGASFGLGLSGLIFVWEAEE